MTKLIPFSLNFKEIDNIVIKSPNIIDIVAKHKNIEILKNVLAKYGVKIAFEYITLENGTQHIPRFAVYKSGNGPLKARFVDDCNEIVFCAKTYRPLLITPRIFGETINPNIEGYTVTKINDGTTFSIYAWEHPDDGIMWNIATAHSYDMGPKYFMGPLNYAEVINESFKRYPDFYRLSGCKLVGDQLSFTLDPNYCHTFIFHHKNFHPIGEDGIWQVQSVNLMTLQIFYDNFNELPIQERVNLPFADLCKNLDTDECRFGYILRNGKSDFIMRSQHLNFLRNVIYTADCGSETRYLFIIFRAFITHPAEIRKFLPVEDLYKSFKSITEAVMNTILKIVRPKSTGLLMPKPTGEIASIARKILDKIGEKDFIKSIGDRNVQSILMDYILNPSFTQHYVDLYRLN